ncbi:hypothetical protein [Cohnella cholangitidis]|uniref:DUF5658 domain-containing protein n=1 Tax=Cohnella cholangitidis TaxID=2598458 RepID=A0A7G5BSK8_9BACL|nr:hypothetical protein [Cohnella cholangitidis]QMV39942.1 hypothetical protein FPL14_01025 [Cohnella cholangitidis]
MNHSKQQAATSVFSLVFSFLASSHHWLHMGVLMLLGSSSNMMETMSAMLGIRRFMIVATVVTIVFAVYRLIKHRCKNYWVISLTALSTIISASFIARTLIDFGW